jgi:hypothetical protein
LVKILAFDSVNKSIRFYHPLLNNESEFTTHKELKFNNNNKIALLESLPTANGL